VNNDGHGNRNKTALFKSLSTERTVRTVTPRSLSPSVTNSVSSHAEPRGASRPRPTPTREQPPSTVSVHFRQGGFSSSLSLASQELLTESAQMADFFGWSRSLHESLPSAGAALEAGSANEPPGAPVVDVPPTQPPFLLGTALDLHGDAETLKISVLIQTPGPAPALTPSPVEEKEKIIAMPVGGRSSSDAVRVSPLRLQQGLRS
jgi:hypothetical protein